MEDFFDPMQFRQPKVAHVVEPVIDTTFQGVDPVVDSFQAGVRYITSRPNMAAFTRTGTPIAR